MTGLGVVKFEWDDDKAASNQRKHGIRFELAMRVFADPYALTLQDRIEAYEYRYQTIGSVGGAVILLVAHTDRDEAGEEIIRIISARRADRRERKRYEQSRET